MVYGDTVIWGGSLICPKFVCCLWLIFCFCFVQIFPQFCLNLGQSAVALLTPQIFHPWFCTTLWTKKTHQKGFLSYFPQNAVHSDKIWYILSWINLQYSSLNIFQLTWIMSLHYLVKLSVVFCKWTAIGTANPKNTPNIFVTSSTKPGRFW